LKTAVPPSTVPLTGDGLDDTVPVPVPAFVTVSDWSAMNVAETVQIPLITPVVYVDPARLPPHPVTEPMV
jgi:hypothetical protein